MLPQFALRDEGLPTPLHVALVGLSLLVHAHDVHLEVVVAHELPIAALHGAHELLLLLVQPANVQLQPAARAVLLSAARIIANERLLIHSEKRSALTSGRRVWIHWCCFRCCMS